MSHLTKYLAAGLASLYLAIAPATAEATSGYSLRLNNYQPKIRADKPNITDIIIVKPFATQKKPIPLELIMELPIMDEIQVTPKPYKPSFLPANLDKMPAKGRVK